MTRHTAPTRNVVARLSLEATGERDESSSYRHKWVTRLRLGELTAEGPNAREAADNLAAELLALASCPEAIEALAMFRMRLHAARETPKPEKAPAPYAGGEVVELRLSPADLDVWVPAEFLSSSHNGSLFAVWSERFGTLTVPPDRVRAVNRPSLADVG